MIRLRFTSVIATALFAACAFGCSDDGGPAKPKLTLRQVSITATPPSKVQVFFTVDTFAGEPVTDLQNADVTLAEDGRTLSALDSQQRLLKSPSNFRAYTAIVLDTTGSIIRGNSLGAVQDASAELARQLTQAGAEHYVGVFTFDGRAKLTMVQAFTNSTITLEQAIASISTKQCDTSTECIAFPDHNTCVVGSDTGLCIDDSTNLYGAFVEGLTTLDNAIRDATGVTYKIGSLVVFTDGADQTARVTRDTAVDRVLKSAHFVYAIGLGTDVDRLFMQVAGKSGNAIANGTQDLTAAFQTAADEIKKETGRYYLLEYCSPKRSGRHEITISATSNEGAQGSLTATFSADGFTSGCTI
jgi:hypothetical protein